MVAPQETRLFPHMKTRKLTVERRRSDRVVELSEVPDGSKRLTSLDALRGFDMFWIVGGAALVSALSSASEGGFLAWIRTQLTHVDWDGFRFYDLIFPLFLFISGVSAVFSLSKAREAGGTLAAARRVILRAALLYLIGVVYAGGISRGWDDIRWMGVLQRIALCYAGASLLYLFLPIRALIPVGILILLGYWAVLAWIPIRDIALEKDSMEILMAETGQTNAVVLYEKTVRTTLGAMDAGRNVANHFDFNYLPGKKWDVYWDPEGILSTFPAIVTALLGIFAGTILRREDMAPGGRVFFLFTIGLLCLVTGMVWGFWFPVIKKIWTSSYVLIAGGYSYMLLATFYWIVDVRRHRRWCRPFVWIGTNALTIYLAANILSPTGGFQAIARRVLGGPVQQVLGNFGPPLVAIGGLILMFVLARALYRRGIFIRL